MSRNLSVRVTRLEDKHPGFSAKTLLDECSDEEIDTLMAWLKNSLAPKPDARLADELTTKLNWSEWKWAHLARLA
jgi:hypothetical protein